MFLSLRSVLANPKIEFSFSQIDAKEFSTFESLLASPNIPECTQDFVNVSTVNKEGQVKKGLRIYS